MSISLLSSPAIGALLRSSAPMLGLSISLKSGEKFSPDLFLLLSTKEVSMMMLKCFEMVVFGVSCTLGLL